MLQYNQCLIGLESHSSGQWTEHILLEKAFHVVYCLLSIAEYSGEHVTQELLSFGLFFLYCLGVSLLDGFMESCLGYCLVEGRLDGYG